MKGRNFFKKDTVRRSIMQIADHIHALKIPFAIPVAPEKKLERFVYAYLVLGSGICLIDSGVHNSHTLIFDYLKSLGRRPEDISLLILTHAHPDHIGSAGAIKAATKCRIAAHPDAQAWIENVEQQFEERPVPGFHTLAGESVSVDRLLQDGEIIDLGPVSLEVIHSPGHARGAISLFCREERVLFSGDAIPLAGELPIYDDVTATVGSINKLKNIPSMAHLLASWADPLKGSEAYKFMDESLEYLERIHGAVREIAVKSGEEDPMVLCTKVVKILGLPEVAVNPLVARSLISHQQIIDRKKLQQSEKKMKQ